MNNARISGGVVASIGMFDGVHRGHQCLIEQVCETARRRGLPAVLVTMDRHPREVLTGERMPLLTLHEDKAALLRAAGADDIVTLPFTRQIADMTAARFMREVLREQFGVSVLVMGYDHRFGCDCRTATADDYVRWGASCGIEVLMARELEGGHVSSSSVRRAIGCGDMREATRLLGRSYSVLGIVVEGKHVGRELGYPTANLSVDESQMLPPRGVYATRVEVKGSGCGTLCGMTNIGTRPTIDDDPRPTIETHIFGWEGDLYGATLRISFIGKIRDTRPFATREELAAQLSVDAQSALSVLHPQ